MREFAYRGISASVSRSAKHIWTIGSRMGWRCRTGHLQGRRHRSRDVAWRRACETPPDSAPSGAAHGGGLGSRPPDVRGYSDRSRPGHLDHSREAGSAGSPHSRRRGAVRVGHSAPREKPRSRQRALDGGRLCVAVSEPGDETATRWAVDPRGAGLPSAVSEKPRPSCPPALIPQAAPTQRDAVAPPGGGTGDVPWPRASVRLWLPRVRSRRPGGGR